MAHRTGFIADTLRKALDAAGFANITAKRLRFHNLLGAAVCP